MTREDCEKFAKDNNIELGDEKRVDALLVGINKNIETYGKGYCPCRIQRIDDNVCPCKPCLEECAIKGKCLCGLYKKD